MEKKLIIDQSRSHKKGTTELGNRGDNKEARNIQAQERTFIYKRNCKNCIEK